MNLISEFIITFAPFLRQERYYKQKQTAYFMLLFTPVLDKTSPASYADFYGTLTGLALSQFFSHLVE